MEINGQRHDARPERAAWLHSGGRGSRDALATAPAGAAVKIDARHDRLDLRQIDVVIGMHIRLLLGRGGISVMLGNCLQTLRAPGPDFPKACAQRQGGPCALSSPSQACLLSAPSMAAADELPGVLGGMLSLASSSATRAARALFCSARTWICWFCSISAKTSAMSSCLLSESSASGHPELEFSRDFPCQSSCCPYPKRAGGEQLPGRRPLVCSFSPRSQE